MHEPPNKTWTVKTSEPCERVPAQVRTSVQWHFDYNYQNAFRCNLCNVHVSSTSDSSQKQKERNTEHTNLPQSILVVVVKWRHHILGADQWLIIWLFLSTWQASVSCQEGKGSSRGTGQSDSVRFWTGEVFLRWVVIHLVLSVLISSRFTHHRRCGSNTMGSWKWNLVISSNIIQYGVLLGSSRINLPLARVTYGKYANEIPDVVSWILRVLTFGRWKLPKKVYFPSRPCGVRRVPLQQASFPAGYKICPVKERISDDFLHDRRFSTEIIYFMGPFKLNFITVSSF